MKTFAFAAFFSALTLTTLNGTTGAEAQASHCGDAPGMERCNDEDTSSSGKDGDAVPRTRTLEVLKSIKYDVPTFVDVNEDLVFTSSETIEATNLHFTVKRGATLTFRAPAVKLGREALSLPLFELSGTVKFEAVGSVPALLDGSLVDREGIVRIDDDNAVFMSGRDDVVRYHASGITVSRMEDTGELDGTHHEEVELRPQLKASLADHHAKLNAKSEVPPFSFTSSYPSFSTTSTSPSSSSSPPSSSSYSSSSSFSSLRSTASSSEAVGDDDESDVCVATPFFGTAAGPDACPNPAFSPADTATTTSAERHKEETHATAGSVACNRSTCPSTSTSTRTGYDNTNGSRRMEHEDEHGDTDGSNDGGSEPDHTTPTTVPRNPTAGDVNPSVSSPKSFLAVGDRLAEPLVSPTGKSAIIANKTGSIIFGKESSKPSDRSGHDPYAGLRFFVLVAAHTRKLQRVLRARQTLLEEMQEGGFAVRQSRRRAWGWVPFRSRHQEDVERARENLGEVEMTLSDRACVEVSLDGICVLSKSGPFKREWMNRFPWQRGKNNDYQLHVTDDGMEVRLGERTVWGVTADEMMG